MAKIASAQISSPKRRPRDAAAWYDYYAGYSSEFARDALALIAPKPGRRTSVLDPWNGSGTTTAVAAAKGYATVGVDRNPALVTIAKARHLSANSVEKSLQALTTDLLSHAKGSVQGIRANLSSSEGLRQWFAPTTTARLRSIERSIQRVLVDEDAPSIPAEPVDPADLSPLSSLFYCALFTITRRLTASFRTSNPTWVRAVRCDEEHVEVSWSVLESMFHDALQQLVSRLTIPATLDAPTLLYEGSAEKLELEKPADVVLSSPPYCTRIDYVIATKPELSVMGHDDDDLKRLRRQMLGTPLTTGIDLCADERWGATATNFLSKVSSHESKAADTYYLRYFTGYMRGLFVSLQSIEQNTKDEGYIGLVVQDSYFKEVHCDLPKIICEMSESLNREAERRDFMVSRTKAAIHPGSRAYRDTFGATESLVVLRPKER